MSEGTERRLAAIISADVVGYSRLMGEDAAGTLTALRRLRNDTLVPQVDAHRGRVVKSMGDGWLVEFASVVDAVSCAIEVQERLGEHEVVKLRIGVHLGDIVHEDEDIYGDGVNIAARLQEIAEPGTIVISDMAWRSIDGKQSAAFIDLGEQDLKNIAKPVTAYGWGMTEVAAEAAALPLPDKPSIAVLPFDNLSGDNEQEFFADGMTEDIITGLSHFGWLFVIARNSTFTFKGRAVGITEVARTLGVQYVLEGSVRKAGNKVRITAQLIDASSGGHIWAERYDRELEDIFVVQDEITEAIVAAIAPEIDETERALAQRKHPNNLDTWSRFQRGLASYYTTTKVALETAIEQFDEINKLDPTFAPAFALGADVRLRYQLHYKVDEEKLMSQAREKSRIGITLEPRNPICLLAESRTYSYLGQHDTAVLMAEEATGINPNSAMANYSLGFVLARAGRCEDALVHIDRAIRLSPRDAFASGFFAVKSIMLFQSGRYQEAAEWARRASSSPNPRPGIFQFAAAIQIKLGHHEEADMLLKQALTLAPSLTLSEIRERNMRHFPRAAAATEILVDALREAGVPE